MYEINAQHQDAIYLLIGRFQDQVTQTIFFGWDLCVLTVFFFHLMLY